MLEIQREEAEKELYVLNFSEFHAELLALPLSSLAFSLTTICYCVLIGGKLKYTNDLSLIQRSYLITVCPIKLQLICFMISEDAPIFILNILFRINQSVTMSLCYYAVASQENMGATYWVVVFPHIVFIMLF